MSLINDVKQDLFTLKGVCVTLLTNLVVLGALCTWIFVNVKVLGHDVSIGVPSADAMRSDEKSEGKRR